MVMALDEDKKAMNNSQNKGKRRGTLYDVQRTTHRFRYQIGWQYPARIARKKREANGSRIKKPTGSIRPRRRRTANHPSRNRHRPLFQTRGAHYHKLGQPGCSDEERREQETGSSGEKNQTSTG